MHEMFRHILEGVVGGKAPDDVEVVGMEVTFGGGRNEFSIRAGRTGQLPESPNRYSQIPSEKG